MATLTREDLARAEAFVGPLYRFRRTQSLVGYVLTELPKLVGATQTTLNHVVPCLRQAQVTAWPEEAQHDERQAALARHAHEHPLICHFLRTGDPRAHKISDFLSRREFHNTALYDELYRYLRYEDQFAMSLRPIGPQFVTLVVARDRRTFTEQDRALLNVLRPHMAQAYRHVQATHRLLRRIESHRTEPASSRVVLDPGDRIVHYPTRAQRWIEAFFGALPQSPGRLPEEIELWLARSRAVQSGRVLPRVAVPLVRFDSNRQLIIRFAGADEAGRTTLLFEECPTVQASRPHSALRLTPRELEVLVEVQKGKHDAEIAASLGIRPRTVKKHLEHIYDKLGVDNRTAAVAELHKHSERH